MSRTTSNAADNLAEKAGKAVVDEVKNQASSPLIQRLMQVGLIVRGLIYFIIGFLAFQFAMGIGGQTANPTSAIEYVGNLPFGKPLLLVIAVGLVGYALWGFVRAIADPLHRGKDTKGLIARAGFLVSGISYALLVIPTI